MKAAICIVLLTALAAPTCGVEASQDPPALSMVSQQDVHEAVERYVRSRLEGTLSPEDRVEVHTRWQGDLLLDVAGRVEYRVRPLSSRPFRGPSVVRVDVVIADKVAKAITLTVDTRVYRPVLVTTRALRRGSPITADMLETMERNIAKLRHGHYSDLAQLEGMQTRRPVGYGDVLTGQHVEPVPVIHRGDEVTVTVQSANMQMSVRGIALQDGGIGSRIRVKNADSGKVTSGVIVDSGTVRAGV
ncbi:flagellar basal body P-ring formation chaperone FlgA [Candidatus Latescibacterota bacterium]